MANGLMVRSQIGASVSAEVEDIDLHGILESHDKFEALRRQVQVELTALEAHFLAALVSELETPMTADQVMAKYKDVQLARQKYDALHSIVCRLEEGFLVTLDKEAKEHPEQTEQLVKRKKNLLEESIANEKKWVDILSRGLDKVEKIKQNQLNAVSAVVAAFQSKQSLG